MKVLFLTILINLNQIDLIKARGRMLDPPQRGSMWRFGFDVPSNYNDMSDNNCGMVKQDWDSDKNCGVCGDPLDQEQKSHEPGGKYATGIIGKTYKESQVINVTIDITANHQGYFEFRLCKNDESMKKVTQDCFDQNLLIITNNNEKDAQKITDPSLNKYKYFLPNKGFGKYYVEVKLPSGVSCKACILQWRYRAGNNVGPKQEEIFNCADIEILEDKNLKSGFDSIEKLNITTTSEITTTRVRSQSNKLVSYFYLNFLLIFFTIC